jgi:hypothetical protein
MVYGASIICLLIWGNTSLPSPKQGPYRGEASGQRNHLAGRADGACVAATTPVRDPFTAST